MLLGLAMATQVENNLHSTRNQFLINSVLSSRISSCLDETRELIGVSSFVKDVEDGKPLHRNDCESDIAPAVCVRVESYLDWISEKIGIQFD